MSVVPICCKVPTLQLQKSVRHCSSANEKQLKSLSGYLEKLQNNNNKSLNLLSDSNLSRGTPKLETPKKDLDVLETYLEKLADRKDANTARPLFSGDYFEFEDERRSPPMRGYARNGGLKSSQKLLQDDHEASNLYLIGVLASINIAVILFEIASPIKSSELELSTIPQLYGAKVNHLIAAGEWWRLVTSMFLHSGAFDIGLSCWSLWTFGPKVCRGYGWFTFLLIYFLGGISSNFISFLHTPESTIGGTGPSYAIIGAYLIYQLQNRDVIPKDVSDTMFQKAIIATGLGLILSHFCPIDEWAHVGAVFTGVAYGFITCPSTALQADKSDSKTGQSDPLKSLFVFGFYVLVLTLLFFSVEPPLTDQLAESFLF